MLGGSSSGGASLLGKLLDQRRPAALLLAALAGVAITAVFDRQHLRQAAPVPANLSNEGLGFAALRKPVPTPQPRPDAWWTACHAQLMSEVEVADDEGKGFDLIFYGDSITETMRGTNGCKPCDRCEGVPEVFDAHYSSKYSAVPLAIGGDQVAHLTWRLQHGELPQAHLPKVVVLNIGTNDLGAARADADQHSAEAFISLAVPGVTLRVLRLLRFLRDNLPDTQIVLMALLPRGEWGAFTVPSVYTPALHLINAHFKAYASLDDHTHFLDCGDRFYTPDQREIDSALMPDALHPNAAGHELLAQCMDPLIATLMAKPATAQKATAKKKKKATKLRQT